MRVRVRVRFRVRVRVRVRVRIRQAAPAARHRLAAILTMAKLTMATLTMAPLTRCLERGIELGLCGGDLCDCEHLPTLACLLGRRAHLPIVRV